MNALRRRLRILSERGTMMVELVIAMVFIAVAVSALLAVFAAGQVSLRNAGIDGTALTLAEAQLEGYRAMPFAEVVTDPDTLPGADDPYATASALDPTIPTAGGQVAGDVAGVDAPTCASAPRPLQGCAIQTLVGPDGRTYRLDTYIHEAAGLRTITVIARQVVAGDASRVDARATTAFDPASTAS